MYFCPCCGYRTFYESPPGSYLICPICFWEDTGDIWGIRKAQLNFLSYGACEQEWLEQVRQPTEQDEKNPHWQLLDKQIKAVGTKLIEQIILNPITKICIKYRRVLDKTKRVFQVLSRSEYLNSITVEQLDATSQFLKFIIDYVPNSDKQEEAQESIEQWHKTNKQSI